MARVLWLLALAACEPIPARSMADLEFPDGFRLDTRHSVAVRFSGASVTDGRVTLRLPDGQPLVEAPVSAALQGAYPLRLPSGTESVAVVIHQGGSSRSWEVPLTPGATTLDIALEAP